MYIGRLRSKYYKHNILNHMSTKLLQAYNALSQQGKDYVKAIFYAPFTLIILYCLSVGFLIVFSFN